MNEPKPTEPTSEASVRCSAVLGARPSDSEIIEYICSLWDSQGDGGMVLGKWIPNITGSFRDSIAEIIQQYENLRTAGQPDNKSKDLMAVKSSAGSPAPNGESSDRESGTRSGQDVTD